MAQHIMESVAIITGANGGIGLAVARRLLEDPERDIRVCLACRNLKKAEDARQSLLLEHPGAQVDLIQLDTSSPQSTTAAAREIRNRYGHVDWLYCNAGIQPVNGIRWSALWPPTPSNLHYNFSTGGDLLKVVDGTTEEGMKEIFTTNVFGHYLLIHHLEDLLISQGRPCHIIWTSSSAAVRANVDPIDVQGETCKDPYAHSKKVVDLLSCELNKRLNDKGVYSHTACPGLVVTQMTHKIMPSWTWTLLYPLFLFVRMFITHLMTLDPYNGSEALVWMSWQDPALLDYTVKYCSRTGPSGRTYIDIKKIEGSEEVCQEVFSQLEQLARRYPRQSTCIQTPGFLYDI